MFHLALLYTLVFGSGVLSSIAGEAGNSHRHFNDACQQIGTSTSSASVVYNISSANYEQDISHPMSSSTQLSACSFEPGTAEDVGIALQILGKSQTPFAVKGGGHASNPGFSSTPGVQISMTRFSDVSYDFATQTAAVGAGLFWDDVYAAIEPYNMSVVGGRVSGVGVAGLTLGGGYSWLTNQYGLALDNVQMFEVVLPNSTVVNVTESKSPDLFFALKGGYNNFGIVTRFTLNTFPQTQVWGGAIIYTEDVLDQVNQATANFAANCNDPKAAIVTTYHYALGQTGAVASIFYDAPSPPVGIFDDFLAIPSLTKNISTRSFLSLFQSVSFNTGAVERGIRDTIPVTSYPLSFIESIIDETTYWSKNLPQDHGINVLYNVEPFLPTILSHNTTPSAYPPSRTLGLSPLCIGFGWSSPEFDQVFQNAARASANRLKVQAIKDGDTNVANAPSYPNYAIFDTPLTDLYGANLPRLQAIKAEVDPDNVMGLAGGFKL